MQEVIKLIKTHNWKDILNWGISLTDSERSDIIEFLNRVNIDSDILGRHPDTLNEETREYFQKRYKVEGAWVYARIVCTRNLDDLQSTVVKTEWTSHTALYLYMFRPALGYEPLVEFFTAFPPDYLNKFLQQICKDRFFNADFKVLWKLHEHGWIKFEEEFFVMRLFTLYGFENNHFKDAQFLIDHPQSIEQVFLKFHKYQIPVLDLIKCETIDYSNGLSAKAAVYWTEVFKILIEKKKIGDREIVKSLFESLLNNWKKPHLDWHIRIIGLFQPTKEEYVRYQQLLISCLHSTNVAVINFAVRCIEDIYKEKEFLIEEFLTNAQSVLVKEKCVKSTLSILSIISYLAECNPQIQSDIHSYISVALLQSEAKIQTKTAELLVKFTDPEILKEVTNPYIGSIKQNAKKILNVTDAVVKEESNFINDTKLQSVSVPSTWEDLLFHVGACISSKSALDIDLFMEGLNQLQHRLPIDFEKQMKPFTKKLIAGRWEVYVMLHFQSFFKHWLDGSNKYPERAGPESPIPFLHHKLKLLFYKLKDKKSLPFLSTPTHFPFYIHPGILIEKLLSYEKAKEEPDLEDLIVACNRVMISLVDEKIKSKAELLKGKYAHSIQYLLGLHNEIEKEKRLLTLVKKLTGESDTLPLWTQMARTKEPDNIHKEFLSTAAKDYPTVVDPFLPKYTIVTDSMWKRLGLEGNWNAQWWNHTKPKKYPHIYYYTASYNLGNRPDIPYQLSLVPNYIDTHLCRYLPDTSSGNEVSQAEQALYPMMTLVEGKVRVHHGGWLYVAFCLLFEKKVSRDLTTEYISISLQNKFTGHNYLAENIGKLITSKFAPVNRLIEFIDRSGNSREVKQLQQQILEKCILAVDVKDMPTNFKKLIAAHYELSAELQSKKNEEILAKLKLIGK